MEHQRELAKLARASYEDVETARQLGAQHDYDILDDDSDTSGRRHHTVFRRGDETVLAFRGTDVKRSKARDLLTDAKLALGITPKELKEAARVAAQVREKHGDVTLIGHSLGGARALHAGKQHGLKSVTFNPYIGPGQRGLHKYARETGSEAHVHLDDEIGSSAVDRLPKSAIIAYQHRVKGHAHAVKHFEGAEGVRLSGKQRAKTIVKQGAKALGAAALVAGALAGGAAAMAGRK